MLKLFSCMIVYENACILSGNYNYTVTYIPIDIVSNIRIQYTKHEWESVRSKV